jgi:ribonuclease HII
MITVGIDEVGRGCWAGPLLAGAVILPHPIEGLRDSKKLSKKQRERLAAQVHAEAVVGLGWVWPDEIDSVGLTESVRLAMERALAGITSHYDEILVDGNINYFPSDSRARAVIKADDIFPVVSAASIVAKVARDKYMSELGERYAVYGFETHVGYGTAAHLAALRAHGISDIHRLSYKPIQALVA